MALLVLAGCALPGSGNGRGKQLSQEDLALLSRFHPYKGPSRANPERFINHCEGLTEQLPSAEGRVPTDIAALWAAPSLRFLLTTPAAPQGSAEPLLPSMAGVSFRDTFGAPPDALTDVNNAPPNASLSGVPIYPDIAGLLTRQFARLGRTLPTDTLGNPSLGGVALSQDTTRQITTLELAKILSEALDLRAECDNGRGCAAEISGEGSASILRIDSESSASTLREFLERLGYDIPLTGTAPSANTDELTPETEQPSTTAEQPSTGGNGLSDEDLFDLAAATAVGLIHSADARVSAPVNGMAASRSLLDPTVAASAQSVFATLANLTREMDCLVHVAIPTEALPASTGVLTDMAEDSESSDEAPLADGTVTDPTDTPTEGMDSIEAPEAGADTAAGRAADYTIYNTFTMGHSARR